MKDGLAVKRAPTEMPTAALLGKRVWGYEAEILVSSRVVTQVECRSLTIGRELSAPHHPTSHQRRVMSARH